MLKDVQYIYTVVYVFTFLLQTTGLVRLLYSCLCIHISNPDYRAGQIGLEEKHLAPLESYLKQLPLFYCFCKPVIFLSLKPLVQWPFKNDLCPTLGNQSFCTHGIVPKTDQLRNPMIS